MNVFLVNARGLDHVGLYGPNAFFDLDLDGRQAKMLPHIELGQHCVVASYESRGTGPESIVVFTTFRLERVEPALMGTHGKICRVFFGEFIDRIKRVKQDAAIDPAFAPCFNKIGHFLRRSVIEC